MTMPTTSIKPGHPYGSPIEWGDGWSKEESAALTAVFFDRLDQALQDETGDATLSYYHRTGEIMYECRGKTNDDGHCLDPLTPWASDPDWADIWRGAGESVMCDAEEILK